MQNGHAFRVAAEAALDGLKRHLIVREEDEHSAFEVDRHNGVLKVIFDDHSARFDIAPNTPVRQIWISALAKSFKLNWDSRLNRSSRMEEFILPSTGETLIGLVDRLIAERRAS